MIALVWRARCVSLRVRGYKVTYRESEKATRCGAAILTWLSVSSCPGSRVGRNAAFCNETYDPLGV